MAEKKSDTQSAAGPKADLPPEARRALAEAEERRRRKLDAEKAAGMARAKEVNGPQGPDPTRYGDWERKGIASDF